MRAPARPAIRLLRRREAGWPSARLRSGRRPSRPSAAPDSGVPLPPPHRAVPGGDRRRSRRCHACGDHRRRPARRRGRLRGSVSASCRATTTSTATSCSRRAATPTSSSTSRSWRGCICCSACPTSPRDWWRSASARRPCWCASSWAVRCTRSTSACWAALFFALSGYARVARAAGAARLDARVPVLADADVLREVADDGPGPLAVRVRGSARMDDPGKGDRWAGARHRGELPAGVAPARPAQRAPRAARRPRVHRVLHPGVDSARAQG